MSHFAMGVIIKEERLMFEGYNFNLNATDRDNKRVLERVVDDMLAPYSENLEVTPYIKYDRDDILLQAYNFINRCKEEKIENVLNVENEKYQYNRELVEEAIENDTDENLIKVANAILYCNELNKNGEYMTNYNPSSKWDWYEVGGRWKGNLDNLETGERVNMSTIKDVRENREDYKFLTNFFGYLTDDDWTEPGEMGWLGIDSSTDESKKEYENTLKDFVKTLKDNDVIVVVDCHI